MKKMYNKIIEWIKNLFKKTENKIVTKVDEEKAKVDKIASDIKKEIRKVEVALTEGISDDAKEVITKAADDITKKVDDVNKKINKKSK